MSLREKLMLIIASMDGTEVLEETPERLFIEVKKKVGETLGSKLIAMDMKMKELELSEDVIHKVDVSEYTGCDGVPVSCTVIFDLTVS